MKNDVSFIVDSDITLYEHQSIYNPNMPIRMLMYLGRQYDKYIKKIGQNMYGKKGMDLPIPKFVTFYNGGDNKADRIFRLSVFLPKGEKKRRM